MPKININALKTLLKSAALKTRQPGVSVPMLQRYYDRLGEGDKPPAIKVADGVIVEGNHRYLAGLAFGKLPEIQEWTASSSAGPIVPWANVNFDPVDWGGH